MITMKNDQFTDSPKEGNILVEFWIYLITINIITFIVFGGDNHSDYFPEKMDIVIEEDL